MIKFHHIATITALLCCTDAYAYDATHLVKASARSYSIPVDFALKVAQKESGIQCGKIGASGERGPLQILPSTAKSLGYNNIRQASCAVQTQAGMKHLAHCYHKLGGNRWMAAACHNWGFKAITTRAAHFPARVKRYANSIMKD